MEPSSSNESAVSTSTGRPSLPLVDDLVALSRSYLVLESHEVVKLARYAMASWLIRGCFGEQRDPQPSCGTATTRRPW